MITIMMMMMIRTVTMSISRALFHVKHAQLR